jgi:hypothetical protein
MVIAQLQFSRFTENLNRNAFLKFMFFVRTVTTSHCQLSAGEFSGDK